MEFLIKDQIIKRSERKEEGINKITHHNVLRVCGCYFHLEVQFNVALQA